MLNGRQDMGLITLVIWLEQHGTVERSDRVDTDRPRKLPSVSGFWALDTASHQLQRPSEGELTLRPRLLVGSSGSCTFTNLRWNARGPEGRSGRNCSSSGSTTRSSSRRPPSRSLKSTAAQILA